MSKPTKKTTVRYVKKITNYTENKDADIPQFGYINVERSHIRRYRNCLYALMGISGCPRNLLDYLVENMSDNNIVGNNKMTRNGFIAACKEAKIQPYSENTIKEAFKELVKVGFLIPRNRGFYVVNPEYFFAGQEVQRNKTIKLTLEFAAGTATSLTVNKK